VIEGRFSVKSRGGASRRIEGDKRPGRLTVGGVVNWSLIGIDIDVAEPYGVVAIPESVDSTSGFAIDRLASMYGAFEACFLSPILISSTTVRPPPARISLRRFTFSSFLRGYTDRYSGITDQSCGAARCTAWERLASTLRWTWGAESARQQTVNSRSKGRDPG
jgi:hypothetical protein